MTLDNIPPGTAVFVDANILLYYFTAHPNHGLAAKKLLDRIETKDIEGHSSTHVLGEVVHRLMTIEACTRFNWPAKGLAQRLRRHPTEVQQLTQHRQAMDEIPLFGLQILAVGVQTVSEAVNLSRQTGLLYADSLVLAAMRTQNLVHLASADGDFDRVAGLTRCAPA
jgi:predicted nucleic acid-binding protein